MNWHDLLFAHWPVPLAALRPHLPAPLSIDTHDGQAWIGVVPFHMTGVGHRLLPCPVASRFPEVNVRTYVTHDNKPGVWFFSLDASSRLAVVTARRWFCLPYFHARMKHSTRDEWISYHSERRDAGAPRARFAGRYRPAGEVFESRDGQLEHFLTARYCLYARHRRGHVTRADIDHAPWQLQPAELELETNSMLAPFGMQNAGPPAHLLFARRVQAVSWTPEPVE